LKILALKLQPSRPRVLAWFQQVLERRGPTCCPRTGFCTGTTPLFTMPLKSRSSNGRKSDKSDPAPSLFNGVSLSGTFFLSESKGRAG
jgi:hypothetical protein